MKMSKSKIIRSAINCISFPTTIGIVLRALFLVPCTLYLIPCSFSQDLHFSQFMNSPLATNPANTGFMPEGDYRLGVNYRNQWSSIMSVPYKTMSAFGDVQVLQNENNDGWVGIGGLILRDVAGSGNLTSTKVYGSVAYHQMLNLGSLLSLGFNAGLANKQINVTNLKFPDQFDGHFFDGHLPTSVALATNNINYLDIQAGMNYAYFPDDNTYFSLQAKSYEWLLGANAHYNLSGNGENILIGGLYYRSGDAIIPMIGLGYKDFNFTFTYDATISTLKNYNNTRGAFEFSLIRQGVFDRYKGNRQQAMCPSFKN